MNDHPSDKSMPSFFLLLMLNSFIFISTALYSPFLSAYYAQQGISSTQIGILRTISSLSSVFIQPLWAKRSDRSGKAKSYAAIVVFGVMLSLYSFYIGSSFGNFLFASCLVTIFSTSVNPLIDAIVVRNANRSHYNFALIRMGGTIGYAIVTLCIGIYLRKNPSYQFMLASVGYLILLLFILRLPASENHQPVADAPKRSLHHLLQLSDIFTNHTIYYVLAFAFIYQLGASFLSGFMGVYVVSLGYGQAQVGMLSCIQAVSEIPVLLVLPKLTKRFGGLHLIAAAGFLMGLRLLVASGGSLGFLMLAQAMQGITYMVIHFGCITYIASHVKEGKASQGQSVLYIVQTGIASIIGQTAGGFVIDAIGIRTSYISVGILVLCSSLVITLILAAHERKIQSAKKQERSA